MDVEQEESIEPQPPPSPAVVGSTSSSTSFQFRPEEIQSSAPDTVSDSSTLTTLASTSSTSLSPPPPPPPRELQSLDSVASTSTTRSSPPSLSSPHGANPVSTEPAAIATEPPVSASTSSEILSSNNKSRSSWTVSTVHHGSVEPNNNNLPLLRNKEGGEVPKTSSNVSVLTGLSSGSFSKFERMSSGAQSSSVLSPADSLDPPPPAGSCDVFIGFHGTDSSLIRYTKWMRAELELHGITCFSADRALYAYAAADHHHHHQQQQQQHSSNSDVALKSTMSSASFGVILISRNSLKNHYTIEEVTHFLAHRNLVPVFFDVAASDCLVRDIIEKQGEVWEVEGGELWKEYSGDEAIWREAVNGMVMVEDLRVEACEGNWRESIQTVVRLLRLRIHEDHMMMNPTSQPPVDVTPLPASASDEVDEFPCPRNLTFVGREKELKTLEKLLILSDGFATTTGADVAQSLARTSQDARSSAQYSDVEDSLDWKLPLSGSLVPHSGGLEGHMGYSSGAYHGWQHETRRRSHSEIHELEKEIHTTRREREARGWPLKRERLSGSYIRQGWKAGQYVEVPSSRKRACVTGISGIGKSELALEFAYRHLQKYRKVLWVGGEDRYLRQNYLDLSSALGIELVGNESKQLGAVRVRAFDDQVTSAIERIRKELEKDLPYLLIIDNLENERDWWDGRELSDLLPRPGMGATDILITTRLPAGVTHIDSFELSFLSTFEALTLMRGGKERSFSVRQLDKFKEFEDKLQRLPLGLAIVGKLISDFGVKPTEILGRMGRVDHHSKQPANVDLDVLQSNPFLEKLLDVCFKLLGEASGPRYLATRMAWVGGWFGPVPCPIPLLGLAAEKLLKEFGGLKMWSECLTSTISCWVSPQSSRLQAEAAALLIKFGIAQPNVQQQSLKFHEIIQVGLHLHLLLLNLPHSHLPSSVPLCYDNVALALP